MSVVHQLIETQEFATLPIVATHVLKMLENDNVDNRELSRVIETDVSLTLKLLRVANSPLYGAKNDINSIGQAVAILGLNRLTNIVLGVSIFSRFLLSSQKNAAELMQKFWWHSSCTGIVAKSLAARINFNFKENEFIGGLLHDIGKLAMLQFDVTKYIEVVDYIHTEKVMDIEAETKIFGCNHLEIGHEISKLWKLPEELTNVISNHNQPDQGGSSAPLIAVVRFADILCELWGADIEEGFLSVSLEEEPSWKVLCREFSYLNGLDFEAFTFELESDYKQSSEFLNILTSD